MYSPFDSALGLLREGVANPDPTRGTIVVRTVSLKLDLNICHDSCLELSGSPSSSSHRTEENWTSYWTGSCTGRVFGGSQEAS